MKKQILFIIFIILILSVIAFSCKPTKITYQVIYYSNGADGGNVPVDNKEYLEGATVIVSGNTGNLYKLGYKFAGWNTKSNGSGIDYKNGNTFIMGESDVSLYAKWNESQIPTYYSVTYYPNGATYGEVPVDNKAHLEGATVTILGNIGNLSLEGYDFAGWNTTPEGNGYSYTAGNTFQIGADDVALYAQWNLIPTYKVTYDPNGAESGDVPVDNNTYYGNDNAVVLDNTGNLSLDGYAFIGWNTESNGSGVSYVANDTFKINANVTLYAQWVFIPVYNVTYNENGAESGDVPVDNNEYVEGATVTVLGNTGDLSLDGYAFIGWNTAANGSGVSYVANDTFEISADVILYAQWSLIPTYSITYNANGAESGNVPVDNNFYYENDDIIVLGNEGNLALSGYVFIGWNTAANGSGNSYIVDNVIKMGTENIVLYAQWSALPFYEVMFDSQGGSLVNSQNIIQGGKVTEPATPTKEGHTFIGWFNEDTFVNQWNFNTNTVSGNMTLYAKWSVNSYTVTFEMNGGTPSISSQNILYEGKVVKPSDPTKEGYIFQGWFKEIGLLNQWNFDTDVVLGNMTLYAKWFDVFIVNNDTLLDANWDFYAGRDVSFSANNLTANDSNMIAPGNPVAVISVSNPTNGTVSLSGNTITFKGTTAGSPASFQYVARTTYESVNYEESGLVTIEKIITPPPVIATNDGPYSMNQGAEMYLAVSTLLSNDIGENGTNSNLTFIGIESGSESNITVVINGSNITITSIGEPYVPAQFQYRIKDTTSNVEAVGTVSFDIGPRPPVEGYVFIDATVFEEFKANNTPAGFEEIFNNWGRFDGNLIFANKAAADAYEASGHSTYANNWELLNVGTPDERVQILDNITTGYNGFFSDENVENYTFEATLSSSDNGDNDSISLIIAYAEVGGIPYALSAFRTGRGATPVKGWGVVEGGTTTSTITHTSDPAGAVVQSIILETGANWSGRYTRVKIERNGDIIKTWTTNFVSTREAALSASYLPSSLIEIDLSSDSRFAKYRGAKPYGYGTFSQKYSTYYDVEFTGGLDAETTIMLTDPVDTDSNGIYDRWNGSEVWKYNGSAWVLMPGLTIQSELGYPRQVTFPGGDTYFIRENYVELVD